MSIDPSLITLSQIELLISSLSRRASKTTTEFTCNQVCQFIGSCGREAQVYTLRCLLPLIESAAASDSHTSVTKSCVFAQLFRQLLTSTGNVKAFLAHFCEAYDQSLKPAEAGVVVNCSELLRALDVSLVLETVLALALLQSSQPSVRSKAEKHVNEILPTLFGIYTNPDSLKDSGLQDCPLEVVHYILSSVHDHPTQFGLNNTNLFAQFIAALKRDFPSESVPIVLLPWLSPDSESVMDFDAQAMQVAGTAPVINAALAQQIKELGYDFTRSVEACREQLQTLGGTDANTLSTTQVAHVLVMMMNTLNNQALKSSKSGDAEQTWHADKFVTVVRELNPSLNWSEVVMKLDQPSFLVKESEQLQFIMTALHHGLSTSAFPVQLLYRDWNYHRECQLSWLVQLLAHPNMFCFADLPCKKVNTDVLKVPPDENSKEIMNWTSLELIEVLLRLSEGAGGLFNEAKNAFKVPLAVCPDLLIMGLLQIQPPVSLLRTELLQALVAVFLNGHPNSLTVLNHAWNSSTVTPQFMRQLIMNCMISWYVNSPDDHSRISRILDVAHDLNPQGLSTLLAMSPHYLFVVDFACLASRRDFLNLNRWLTDKLRDLGEQFAGPCVQFLRQKAAHALGLPGAMPPQTAAAQNTLVSLDTARVILDCLQVGMQNYSTLLQNDIKQLMQHCAAESGRKGVGAISAPGSQQQPAHDPAARRTPVPLQMMSGGGPPGPQQPVNRNIFDTKPFGTRNIGADGSYLREHMSASPTPLVSAATAQFMLEPHSSPMRSKPAVSGTDWLGAQNSAGDSQYTQPSLMHNNNTHNAPYGLTASNVRATQQMQSQQHDGGSADNNAAGPDVTSAFSEEVQGQANFYFQQIYAQPPHQQLSVPEFVAKLKLFRDGKKNEQDVFACMLKNLFEEYQFFGDYPDRELIITAELFGLIIRDNIITGVMLATALRYVINSCQPVPATGKPNQKMFQFGARALDELKPLLRDYPKYSEALANLPQSSSFSPKLMEYIRAGAQGQWPVTHNTQAQQAASTSHNPGTTVAGSAAGAMSMTGAVPGGAGAVGSHAQGAFQVPSGTATRPKGPTLQTTNINILMDATEREESQVIEPNERLQEKMAFLFNNLSQVNLTVKTREIRKTALESNSEQYLPWLAQYLVMKRVSIEPNFHPLYCNFLTEFANDNFERITIEETYRNVKILLRSDKRQAVSNFGDRQLLKNLGHWLGMITLGKNKAVLYDELDLKSLILEAYYKGSHELLYVVPFVAKVLESCSKSKVFLPTGAYMQAILVILAELHREPDLKLNLKFEIEVLFKSVDIEFVEFSKNVDFDHRSALKDTERLASLRQQLGDLASIKPDLNAPVAVPGTASPLTVAQPARSQRETDERTHGTDSPPPPKFSYHQINVTSPQGLAPHIRLNAQLALFQVNPMLKNMVRAALEHAVQELIAPVTDRAIKVAMTTTEHVVKKDFGAEPDETRMRQAAHHMMRSLTAGMAMITCHEPLLITLEGYLKQAFYSALRSQQTDQLNKLIDEAAHAIAVDNVELAQSFIVKTACEKGIPEIDKRLEPDFIVSCLLVLITASVDAQNRQRLRRENMEWTDSEAMRRFELLPEALREMLKSANGHSVYAQFSGNISGFKPTTAEDMIVGSMQSMSGGYGAGAAGGSRLPASMTATAGAVTMSSALGAASGTAQLHHTQPPQAMQHALAQHTNAPPPVHGAAGNQQQNTATSAPSTAASGFLANSTVTDRELEVAYGKLISEMDSTLTNANTNSKAAVTLANMREAIREAAQTPRDPTSTSALVCKLVEQLLHGYNTQSTEPDWMSTLRSAFVYACQLVAQVFNMQWIQKAVTKALIECRQDYRYNLDAIDVFVRTHLLNMTTYDLHLANMMDSGLNMAGVQFAQRVIKHYLIDDTTVLTQNDLGHTVEMLSRSMQPMSRAPVNNTINTPNDNSSMVLDMIRAENKPQQSTAPAPAAPVTEAGRAQQSLPQPASFSGISDDPPDLHQKVERILREWIPMSYTPRAQREPGTVLAGVVSLMHEQGVLRSDDTVNRFFRLCVEMCVEMCYRALHKESREAAARQAAGQTPSAGQSQNNVPMVVRQQCFYTLDAFVRLAALMIRYSDGNNIQTKSNLMRKILTIVCTVLCQDHEMRRNEFHQLPYHRILMQLFWELTTPDETLDQMTHQTLDIFCQAMINLQPRRVPGFAYAWLEMLGHRSFMARMLAMTQHSQGSASKMWSWYTQLIVAHIKFLAPFLRNIELPKPIALMYKGTLRVLLVLLHDFPELLCDYHYVLCEAIPPNCVQLRNLVLSAYPRNMRLPDPFMQNLRVDQLAEINHSPKITVNVQAVIPTELKTDIDNYLESRSNVTFLSELRSKLQAAQPSPGNKYNMSVMNAVVLYVGMRAIEDIHSKGHRPNLTTIAHTPYMDMFQNLAVSLDTEGRYLFFNAIANQLRYPNSHTHYFSCLLLYLFLEANSQVIQEQITRILFERLVALRPHPWGLLITFIELIKNNQYGFWKHEFTRCAPEIERLFQSVAMSCMGRPGGSSEASPAATNQ